jgi:hypothetical membrane protein
LLFIISYSIQGIFKKGYNALRHPISSLAIGQNGFFQVFTFIVTGILIILFAVAVQKKIHKKATTILFVLVGVGLIASGVFNTDPVYGYPPELPFTNKIFTMHGKLHTLFSLFVFLNIPIICFLMARYFNNQKEFKWKYYSIITGTGMLLLFLFTGFAFNNAGNTGAFAGLIQRLCVITGFIWIILFASYIIALNSSILNNNGTTIA